MSGSVQRRVPVYPLEYGNSEDINSIGVFAVDADDALGLDLGGPNVAWTGMSVATESNSSVRVTFGRVWRDGKFYGNPDSDSEVVSLITTLPTSTKKIVTIIGTGQDAEHNVLPRQFKNATSGVKEPQPVATEILRKMSLSYVSGAEGGTPVPPAIDPSYIPIAEVTLTPAGIESVVLLTDYQMPTVQGVNTRVLSLETFRENIGSRVETLASDLASVRGDFAALNAPAVRQSLRRITDLEDRLGIDDTGLLSGFDRFLMDTESDTGGLGYDARVEEGLRFPYAASDDTVPALLNPGDPRVQKVSGWTLPVYDEIKRLDIWGQDISVNVSNYQYANTSFEIYPGAQRRRRYGPSMVVAGNSDFWQSSRYNQNYLAETFGVDGENYLISDEWTEGGVTYYRVNQYWDDQIKYWDGFQAITPTTQGGYIVGQTFLNAQAGWMTSVGLRFGRVDDAYGIKVYLCKAPLGEPDPNQVVSEGSIAAGDVLVSQSDGSAGVENKVSLTPVFLDPGERYGIIIVTGGDYAVACRTDNALTNGAFFIGDGSAWAVDLGKDMAMRLYFASFQNAYTAVQMATVTLSGGITDLDLLTSEHVPDGCELYWMVRYDGTWHRLEKFSGTHPLASGPATLEVQIVMVGTHEVMPGIRLGDSKIHMHRAGVGFTHYSEVRDAGSAAATVRVEMDIANWDGAKHSLTVTVESGANSDAPDSTTDTVLSDGSIRRVMIFTLTAPSQTYQIKAVGTSSDNADTFVIGNRYDLAAA